jgi:hypothetical protein
MTDLIEWMAGLAQALVGLLFMAIGLGILAGEFLRPPTHSGHVYLAVALAVFGGAVLPSIGPAVMKALSAIVSAIVQLLPFATKTATPPSAPPPSGLPKDGP